MTRTSGRRAKEKCDNIYWGEQAFACHKTLAPHSSSIPISCNTNPLSILLGSPTHIWSFWEKKLLHSHTQVFTAHKDKSTAYIELYSKWKLVRTMTRWWACDDMNMWPSFQYLCSRKMPISRHEHTVWFLTEFDKMMFWFFLLLFFAGYWLGVGCRLG